MSRIIAIFLVIAISIFNSHAAYVDIKVGVPDCYSFLPQNATANPGDTLRFLFVSAQASVVQSDGPAGIESCKHPKSGGFLYNSTANPPPPVDGTFTPDKFEYQINQTSGNIFFICDLPGRCENGMFGMVTIGSGSGIPTANSTNNPPLLQSSKNSSSSNSPNDSKNAASTTYANTFTYAVILASSIFVYSFIF
ncbi:891_t:CDS:2 [Cetraspora pellucida]|uniref:891_t:CDS:1 n=1 Tax=Cetraspora pellucida TaxID=1433469 RepID=A0ACA9K4P6_9GLOM|nr:891_t:CDS:2 [Cetraspora pellucida]